MGRNKIKIWYLLKISDNNLTFIQQYKNTMRFNSHRVFFIYLVFSSILFAFIVTTARAESPKINA